MSDQQTIDEDKLVLLAGVVIRIEDAMVALEASMVALKTAYVVAKAEYNRTLDVYQDKWCIMSRSRHMRQGESTQQPEHNPRNRK